MPAVSRRRLIIDFCWNELPSAALMSDSLRNQLIGLGFKLSRQDPEKVERRRFNAASSEGKTQRVNTVQSPSAERRRAAVAAKKPQPGAINLAQAYALRAEKEKQERIEAEQLKQAQARQRRLAKARLGQLLQQKALNAADAEIARHFEYGGKIKRIYVTLDQLKALNSGHLGVVQHNGRFLLVEAAVVTEAEQILPSSVALNVNVQMRSAADMISDPRFQVPDDLIW